MAVVDQVAAEDAADGKAGHGGTDFSLCLVYEITD